MTISLVDNIADHQSQSVKGKDGRRKPLSGALYKSMHLAHQGDSAKDEVSSEDVNLLRMISELEMINIQVAQLHIFERYQRKARKASQSHRGLERGRCYPQEEDEDELVTNAQDDVGGSTAEKWLDSATVLKHGSERTKPTRKERKQNPSWLEKPKKSNLEASTEPDMVPACVRYADISFGFGRFPDGLCHIPGEDLGKFLAGTPAKVATSDSESGGILMVQDFSV